MALPLGDPAYEQLTALERAGCTEARVAVTQPYDVRSIRWALGAATRDDRCAGPLLDELMQRFKKTPSDTGSSARAGAAATLSATGLRNGEFFPLWENVRPAGQGDPSLVGIGNARVSWGEDDKLAVVVDGYVESNSRNDPLVRAKQFRRTTAVIDFGEAYVAGRALGVTLSLGREREAWLSDAFDGGESFMLGANGPPIDRLAADFRTTHFEGHVLFGSLDDVVLTPEQDSINTSFGPQHYYRWLAGHELTWRPSRVIELSAGETALLSRAAQGIDLYYVNPFVPYIMTQNDTGRTATEPRNNLTAFTAMRLHVGRATLGGQLLIDDIQIDAADRRVTPDQLGWDLMARAPLPIDRTSTVQLTYERVDSYTYQQPYYMEVWQYYNTPIGSELGPDADYAHVDADVFVTPRVRFAGGLGEWRRGLQRIYERPAQGPVGHAGVPFPTTVPGEPVQTATLGYLSAQLLTVVLPVTARIDLARIRNVNNAPAPAALYASLKLTARYAFRYP